MNPLAVIPPDTLTVHSENLFTLFKSLYVFSLLKIDIIPASENTNNLL